MAVKIINRAGHLLGVPLNSGATIYLAPGELSDPVEDYEVEKNEYVEKLLAGELIGLDDAEPAALADTPKQAKKREPTRAKGRQTESR